MRRNKKGAWAVIAMTFDVVDMVWSAMGDDEFYSPSDLANSLGHATDAVTRVLEFLAKYGFAERVTRREMIFRKLANAPSPVEALKTLQMLLEETGDVERASSVSTPSRRLKLS
jgi:hypothetical protein